MRSAVDHLSATFGVGRTGLVGANGTGKTTALRAIESGDADPIHFDALADDWDVEARSLAALDGIGLPGIALDRPVGTLSGGETVLTAIAGLQLSAAEVVLLDEPTNNFDRLARGKLYDAISSWRGSLTVVSHGVVLLNLMQATAELRDGALSVFRGPLTRTRSTSPSSRPPPSKLCVRPSSS